MSARVVKAGRRETVPEFVHIGPKTTVARGRRYLTHEECARQVVGRGLRRRTYELNEQGLMTEEVATVFGVPFQVIPFKANPAGTPTPPVKRHHVQALAGRAHLEIRFPRVPVAGSRL